MTDEGSLGAVSRTSWGIPRELNVCPTHPLCSSPGESRKKKKERIRKVSGGESKAAGVG